MRLMIAIVIAGCGSVNTNEHADARVDGKSADTGASTQLSVTLSGSNIQMVTSDPPGITCTVGTCMASFPTGTDVTLTAASSKYYGVGWAGACTGTGPCVVHVTADTAVTASAIEHCDHFAQADSTTITGWTERTGDWSVVSGAIQHPETGSVYTNHITRDNTMIADGCVHIQARLGVGPANIQAVGAVLRWSAGPSYVVALVQNNTGSTFNQTYIYQYPGGTSLGMGAMTDYGLTPSIEACIAGTSVTLKVDANNDGTYESTTTGTTTLAATTGLVGVMTHTFGMPSNADDFCWDP